MKRPTGITILALIAIIGGVLVTLFSGVFPLPGAEPPTGVEQQAMAVGLLVGGILCVAFGIAAWFTRTWAYWLGIVAGGVLLASAALNLWRGVPSMGSTIALGLAAGILYLLVRPKVRRAFVVASTPPVPPPAPAGGAATGRRNAIRRKPRRH
ncbi:MAG: DUF2127 domain-containing protein [Anaerolineae bacterium]